MAAGAMATFISRVSSFLLAAATLSATNQPLNNQQQHLRHHHQIQHHNQRPTAPSHLMQANHQPIKFHHQPQSLINGQQHMSSLLAAPINHRHHFAQPPPTHHQQLTNRQATVNAGHLFNADLTSSSTSRASNTGGATFTTGSSSSASSASPAASSIPLVQQQQQALSSPASAAAASQNSLSSSSVPPSSSIFDVFEYVMHYKPSTPLISPSSLAFNTIPLSNFNTLLNNKRHQHHQAAAAASSPLHQSPLAQISAAALQQQNRRHYQQQAPISAQQVLQPSSQPPPPPSLQPPPPPPQKTHQVHQQQHLQQQQKANNGSLASSSSSLPEISRSNTTTTTTTTSAAASIGRGILSRFSLLQSPASNNQRREDVCGRTMQTPQRRIIGGEGARYGEFPYQVHIKIAKHQCGGALVDRQSIVTAAHCVYHFMTRAPVSKLQIVIGAYDIEDEQYQELPPQYFKVNKVKLHPQFRFSASHPDRYDIAILKLDKPVKYTDNVLPVCLPSRELKFESMIGTVTGFGKTDPSLSNRYGTRLLQKVDVPIIENNECERWHRTRGIDLKIFPEMMCAGYEDGLKDACVGDSGGPLVVKTSTGGPNGSFRWTLAGITSAGFGCAQSRQPGIYHRVSHTVDWILENLEN